MTTQENVKLDDIHQQCSLSNDFLIKSCLNRKCLDNITLVIVAFENFERIFSYPVLHTYEDQPISKKLLLAEGIDTNQNSTRITNSNLNSNANLLNAKRQTFEKISKVRCESVKNNNNNPPASSKGMRPKISNFEENNFNLNSNLKENLQRNNSGSIKQMTPLNSAKERYFNFLLIFNFFI